MKKKMLFIPFLIGILLGIFVYAGEATAYTINDLYIGGNTSGWNYGRDVIGDLADFDVSKMEVTFAPNKMIVDIYSTYFDSASWNTYGTYIGDLFISSNGYSPHLPTKDDNYTNGEDWEFGIVLSDRTIRHTSTNKGSIQLYSISNSDGSIMSNHPWDPQYWRQYQELMVNTNDPNNTLLSSAGEWFVSDDDSYLRISLDNSSYLIDAWNGESLFGFHWTMSCGNDVIEGSAPVPVPPSILLLSSGLMGMWVFGRRRLGMGSHQKQKFRPKPPLLNALKPPPSGGIKVKMGLLPSFVRIKKVERNQSQKVISQGDA